MMHLVLLLLISPILLSAQVPNGGFENWDSVGMHLYPTGWVVINGLDKYAYGIRRSYEAYSGDYALHFSSDEIDNVDCASALQISSNNPFNRNRDQILSFYFKSIPYREEATPWLNLNILIYKNDTLESEIVKWKPEETTYNYEKVEIELPVSNYDSIVIDLFGSACIGATGCHLTDCFTDSWIDDIQISEVVSTGEISERKFRILGNPASDQLRISSDQMPQAMGVIDLNGRTLAAAEHAKEIQVDHLAPGMYLLELAFPNGQRKVE